ncbi:MAG: SusD/RagB family nutrient-binding outer membrane lipoprotein [Dysgonomonas sp.]|nr:SusD/RagB family nutrient-binding outer membrane lipoprotein [Dysgonomonas sp.]
MKIKNILSIGLLSASALLASCIDEDLNKDPGAMNQEQLKPEWSLNASISNSQMDPHIAERVFVLTWKYAAHFERGNGFTLGSDSNDWMNDYLAIGYGAGWLRDVNLAITIAQEKIDAGDAFPYYANVQQMARIWRAQLLADFAATFGPMPTTEAFQGSNPIFESEENVYKFILTELKDAAAAIDPSISMTAVGSTYDLVYASDMNKWIKYANSLRMRIAMRISNANPALAQQHFEEASNKDIISTQADMAKVTEYDGWSPFSGVMSRTWNAQNMSKTFYNLVVGLGGTEFPVPTELAPNVKNARTYLGLKLEKHFPLTTNDPSAGYFFDGIPQHVDPRAPLLFHITGYRDKNGVYPAHVFGDAGDAAINPGNFKPNLLADNGTDIELTLNIANTWSTIVAGIWDKKGTLSTDYTKTRNLPALAQKYRTSDNYRVFFGPWETYFLLAEAKLKGWSVPGTTKENYEKGIAASFEYHGISSQLSAYLASTDYSRVGTSVAFDHTTEAADYTINYTDGYTKAPLTTTYKYPKNSIYKNGSVNNDALTKIITQKYLAQMPWLPLESWTDHRRLGLPFFENQAVENAYDTQSQVALTPENSTTCSWEFYPKRVRYPLGWSTIDPKGYQQAQSLLNGPDKTTTSLWWSN